MPGLEDLTTDQLLAQAREFQNQAALLSQLTSNPETRETVQRALKKINPKLSIPEIDAKDAVLAVITEERTARQKLETQILERDIRERLEKDKSRVQTKHRLSEEDMKGVEALMIDKDAPIPTYEAAAMVFKAQRQSAVPTPASFVPPVFEMPEKDVWGKGIGRPAILDKIALNEAYGAWNEIMSGKVAGLGAAR